METLPPLDAPQAHVFFSTHCFNRAWELIDKPQRSAEEDEQMLLLSLASLWHWTQREGCTSRNLSIGYWQAARICCLLAWPESAIRYGVLCLRHSDGLSPFYQGYAHEVLARARALAGDAERAAGHLDRARELSTKVGDPEERSMLEKDLDSIR